MGRGRFSGGKRLTLSKGVGKMYFPTFAIGARVRAVVNVDSLRGEPIYAGSKGRFQRVSPYLSGQTAYVKFDNGGEALVREEEIETVTGEEE